MKNNTELEKDVREEIKWSPILNGAEIGVTAKDGVITLTGTVDSYTKKLAAEDAAKRVKGVKAVAEEIRVQFSGAPLRSDTEIATSILDAFKSNWSVPDDDITVKVEEGWVTLSGEVSWNYQRESAVEDANKQTGVVGVTNLIAIKSDVADAVERESVESALRRDAFIDESDVFVNVSGGLVTLTGTVNSWSEFDEASRVAWSAPGVTSVDNLLVVDYDD
jgi:osmotically-inducible protein OsmY